MVRLRRWLAGLLLTAHMHAARAADIHPLDIPVKEYLLVLVASMLGGFVSWYARLKRGNAQAWSLMTAVGETCTAVMAGLLTFWGCTLFDTPQLLTVSLVAVAGHMGAKAISAFEAAAERRFGTLTGQPDNEGRP